VAAAVLEVPIFLAGLHPAARLAHTLATVAAMAVVAVVALPQAGLTTVQVVREALVDIAVTVAMGQIKTHPQVYQALLALAAEAEVERVVITAMPMGQKVAVAVVVLGFLVKVQAARQALVQTA
jgi:hypothetical protein